MSSRQPRPVPLRSAVTTLLMSAAVLASVPGYAQTLAPGEADPGVKPTRMIDRAEVRVSRIEMQPGSARRVHTHDDVIYHLWIPIEGSLQITIGTNTPVAAASGQAFFMTRGTSHGFKNIGTTPGAALEIFIKQTTTAGLDPLAAIAGELAALAAPRHPVP